MARHIFKCEDCQEDFGVDVPGLAVPPGSPSCPSCKNTNTYKNYKAHRVFTHVEGGTPKGLIHYKDTAEAMARFHGRDTKAAFNEIKQEDKIQRQGKHLKGSSRTKGAHWRKIGSMPVDHYHARTIQAENKEVWREEVAEKGAKNVLKREGFYLGD